MKKRSLPLSGVYRHLGPGLVGRAATARVRRAAKMVRLPSRAK